MEITISRTTSVFSQETCESLLNLTLEEVKKNSEYDKPQRKLFGIIPTSSSVSEAPSPEFGLVVDGQTLSIIFQGGLEEKFLALAQHCRSVLCCRATPLHKSMVVKLVRRHLKVMTLSIGTSTLELTGDRRGESLFRRNVWNMLFGAEFCASDRCSRETALINLS